MSLHYKNVKELKFNKLKKGKDMIYILNMRLLSQNPYNNAKLNLKSSFNRKNLCLDSHFYLEYNFKKSGILNRNELGLYKVKTFVSSSRSDEIQQSALYLSVKKGEKTKFKKLERSGVGLTGLTPGFSLNSSIQVKSEFSDSNALDKISSFAWQNAPTEGQSFSSNAGKVFLNKSKGFEKVFKEENMNEQGNRELKTYNTSYSKLSEVKLLTIGIASPLRILQWAEKTLPNGKVYGEVLNANTLHHKTFKPQKGGLFCERIFGPLKDFECACGKVDKSVKKMQIDSKQLSLANKQENNHQTILQSLETPNSNLNIGVPSKLQDQNTGIIHSENEGINQTPSVKQEFDQAFKISRKFCPDCDVEYTWSVIRRYQLGYIKLNSPVTHIWFLKGTPSYLSLLLDMKKRYLQFVTYCSETLTIEKSSLPFYSTKDSYTQNSDKSLRFPEGEGLPLPGIEAPNLNGNQNPSINFKKPSQINELGYSSFNKNEWGREIRSKFKCIPQKGWYLNCVNQTRFDLQNKGQGNAFGLNGQKSDNRGFLKNANLPFILSSSQTSSTSRLRLGFSESNLNLQGIGQTNKKVEKTVSNKEVLVLTTLLLSIYYKHLPNFLTENKTDLLTYSFSVDMLKKPSPSFGNMNTKVFRNELPNLKILFKKLPVDLYILCSLERMLHKSSIHLSIKKAWGKIYKKAFVKAINKAKMIFTQFLILNKNNPGALRWPVGALEELKNEMNLTNMTTANKEFRSLIFKISKTKFYASRISLIRSEILNYLQSQTSFSALPDLVQLTPSNNTKKEISILSNTNNHTHSHTHNENHTYGNLTNTLRRNQKVFKSLKDKYGNHVLKLLEKIRYPILSLNFTKLFLEQNSFYQIQKLIAFEMTNYFTENTDYLEKLLSELFLNSLLSDQFINIYEKRALRVSSLNEEQVENLAIRQVPVLNTLKNFLIFKKNFSGISYSSKTKLYSNKTTSYANKTSSYANTTTLYSSLVKDTYLLSQSLQDPNGTQFPGFAKEAIEALPYEGLAYETQKTKIANASEFLKDSINISKKKIYNNVYTLSHRERWDIDKDWYIFSLFTFGITEYTDYPINTYKNRLLSLTTFQDYSYNGYLGENLTFPKDNLLTNNALSYSNKTSSYASTTTLSSSVQNNVSKVSASFIYSSSFYSGAGIVQQLLNEFDFEEIQKLDKQNRLLLYQLNKSILKLKKLAQIFVYDKNAQLKLKELCKKRDLLIRRTKLVRKMFRKNTNPASMILTVIPVLPPDLRPIVKMGSQIAASDLNRLYQRVIYRNDRLKKFLKDPATSQSYEMKYAQRLLQEAVDNLMQNGKSGPNSEKDARGRALKSLSDILKGKQGRFRQFLLGKRVDYSGRSVIVVGPKLKLHECGLPLEMAKELYLPFLLKSILNKNYTKTVVGAKTLIQNNPSLANQLLNEIMQVTPVLLNRAPTLHRLGIQAFVPKLIEGRAILLHPLVCSAFNADFDGDQMAVHVPITVEARAEAWKMLLSPNNLLSPATGEPLAIPSQDMVLGCYYLTTLSNKTKNLRGSGAYFNSLYDVLKLYEQQLINIHSFVWIKWKHTIQNGSDQESPLEIRISPFGQWQEITSNYQKTYDLNNNLIHLYMCTTPGRILFNFILQSIV